jgi:hypothetical protein
MSILSSTQGTPERVWSLISLLAASEGELSRTEAAAWLNPEFTRADQIVGERPTAFAQVLGAATSLGAVEVVGTTLRLNPACEVNSFSAFADWVHDRLVLLDSTAKDAVILEAYAWVVAQSARTGGTTWMATATNSEFADAAQAALPEGSDDDGERRINTVKLPSWRRWLTFMGLMEELPVSPPYHPFANRRLKLELRRLEFERDQEIPADDFFRQLRLRLPYIDGGRMFADAARRVGHAFEQRQISPIFSAALRDLHDDGTLEMQMLGDLGTFYRLTPDPSHKIHSLYAVVVKEGA